MFRLSCLLISAGLAVVASAQDTTAKITYSAPAAPASTQLEAVSKQAGVPLMTSPDMSREILILKVKDMPLSTFMADVAKATSGSWIPDSGGFRLVVDPAGRRGEALASRTMQIRKVTDSLAKMTEGLDKTPRLTPGSVKTGPTHGTASLGSGGASLSMTGGGDVPSDRALLRLLRLIGPSALASIEMGDRVVYATNANRSQLPMPGGSESAIQTLVDEQRVYADAQRRAKASEKPDNTPPDQAEAANQMKAMFGIDPDANSRTLDGPPSKVLLVASREAIFGGISVQLLVYDVNGKVLLSSRQNIPIGGGMLDMAEMMAAAEKLQKPAPKPPPDKDIELSHLSKEMLTLRSANGLSPGSLETKIPDDLRQAMLRPDLRDPLSFGESEALFAYADLKGQQLVAELPDSMVASSMTGSGPTATMNAFSEKLKKACSLESADNVLVVKPLDPFEARSTRVDRKALANLVQDANGKEFVPLDDLAQYAIRNPEPSQTPGATTYFMVFASDALQGGMSGRADWNMLRLFATLSASERDALARGAAIPFANMGPQESGYASRLLFGANAHLQVQDADAKKSDLPAVMDLALAMFRTPNDYRSEPTEAMPNGLPREGRLTLNLSKEPVAKSTSQGMIGMAALGLDELAMLTIVKNEPQFAQAQAFLPNLNELRIGSRDIYTFRFQVSPVASTTQMLIDNKLEKDAPAVPIGNLPSDMQKQLDSRIASFKKLPFFGPGMFGGAAAPRP